MGKVKTVNVYIVTCETLLNTAKDSFCILFFFFYSLIGAHENLIDSEKMRRLLLLFLFCRCCWIALLIHSSISFMLSNANFSRNIPKKIHTHCVANEDDFIFCSYFGFVEKIDDRINREGKVNFFLADRYYSVCLWKMWNEFDCLTLYDF